MHGESLEQSPQSRGSAWNPFVVIVVLWGMCLAYSLLRAPIPGPNEPHYLAKARHFWDADWCAGDLFLESSNPHAVFYALIGWLPSLVGFETAALIGRVLATLLLAIGWQCLAAGLRLSSLATAVSMGLLLTFQALGNLSGEWLIGGVESKTFSYALAFLGWGLMMNGRTLSGAACLGGCFSLHPVIGGWVLLATIVAVVMQSIGSVRGSSSAATRSIVPCLAAGGMTLLGMSPGLVASWPIIKEGSSPQADLLQVGDRLTHHLDPLAFHVEAWRYYALLLVIGGLATWIVRLQITRLNTASTDQRTAANVLMWWIVAASLAFAVAGIAIAWGERPFEKMSGAEWRAGLLKFYPFRLVDVLLPAWTALEVGLAIGLAVPQAANALARIREIAIALVAVAVPLLVTWRMPYPDRPASRMTAEREADWREVCGWVRDHTPSDALLWTADARWAVKWHAERAEYVNYKDCPQDAAGIEEWLSRRRTLVRWHVKSYGDQTFTVNELRQLHRDTGITHVIWDRAGEEMPRELLLHSVGEFQVYALVE